MSEDSRKATSGAIRVGIGLLSLCLIFGLYFGAYRLALDPTTIFFKDRVIEPAYRFRHWLGDSRETVDLVFKPAFLIDQKIRPAHWDLTAPSH
jgi:hypothetical protein